jgi:hypothetical protein
VRGTQDDARRVIGFKKEAQLLARSACLLGDVSCCEDERCPKYAEHLASGLFPAGSATACRGGFVAHSTRKRTTIKSNNDYICR